MRRVSHPQPELRWLLSIALASAANAVMAQTCHYQDWSWNTARQRAVQKKTVIKDSSELRPDELDVQSGCTVCEEDQQVIRLDGLPEFSVCKRYSSVVLDTLLGLIRQGEKIESVIGYRVGRTRGELDAQGNRTGFSNHSYGVAIDINTRHNGLYDNCVRFGPQCRLLRAGPWRPGEDPFSLQRDGLIVSTFKQAGFKWGGEIEGQQKDFMHFSPTGY